MSDELKVLAAAAGLSLALRDYPKEITEAFEAARAATRDLKLPADKTAEPWPPMRAGYPA